jgi:quercetin dioxygenase-like cupin family protein
MTAKILGPNEGKYMNVIGDQQWIKLSGKDTNGAYAMIEQRNPPGTSVPPHLHSREDETFYIAEGTVRFTVEDRDIVAGPGTTVFLAKKTPHSFVVVGDTPMRAIIIVSPSGCEDMFQELAELPPGPPDMTKVAEICGRYGVHFV